MLIVSLVKVCRYHSEIGYYSLVIFITKSGVSTRMASFSFSFSIVTTSKDIC